MYFEKRLLKRDHTKVIYIINCPDLSNYSRTDLEKLREMVATLLSAEFDDIILSGIKNGCVIVTFMIRNCLISKLRALYTPENRSMTCQRMFPLKFKVLKVIVQDETIYPSEKSNAEEKPSEKVQDAPLNSSEEIERTVDNVDNILECNDNATSNVKVGNILECNDNTTSNLQKRDFTTDLMDLQRRVANEKLQRHIDSVLIEMVEIQKHCTFPSSAKFQRHWEERHVREVQKWACPHQGCKALVRRNSDMESHLKFTHKETNPSILGLTIAKETRLQQSRSSLLKLEN